MGRTRTKSKKAAKLQIGKSADDPPTTSSTSQAPTIESLIDKAKSLIDQCDYDFALRFIQRILHRQVAHAEARELLGIIELETGELDAAKETFTSLIPPSTTAVNPPPPSAYLYLAQLSDNDPNAALGYYQTAVDTFMNSLKGKERAVNFASTEDDMQLKLSIVRALIAMVEIWMDPAYDLCFDPNAEKTCEDLIALALKTDPGNAEAQLALASVRMSQQRPEDAQKCLEDAWSSWRELELDDVRMPSIQTRLSFVKLFLELSLFTPALMVLHGVMAMDDQEVEAWYLEGWCFHLMAKQAKETGQKIDELSWEELGRDARDCLETCLVLHQNEQHPDTPLLLHAKELISQLDQAGIKPSPPNEDPDVGEEWEDAESDEDIDME